MQCMRFTDSKCSVGPVLFVRTGWGTHSHLQEVAIPSYLYRHFPTCPALHYRPAARQPLPPQYYIAFNLFEQPAALPARQADRPALPSVLSARCYQPLAVVPPLRQPTRPPQSPVLLWRCRRWLLLWSSVITRPTYFYWDRILFWTLCLARPICPLR